MACLPDNLNAILGRRLWSKVCLRPMTSLPLLGSRIPADLFFFAFPAGRETSRCASAGDAVRTTLSRKDTEKRGDDDEVEGARDGMLLRGKNFAERRSRDHSLHPAKTSRRHLFLPHPPNRPPRPLTYSMRLELIQSLESSSRTGPIDRRARFELLVQSPVAVTSYCSTSSLKLRAMWHLAGPIIVGMCVLSTELIGSLMAFCKRKYGRTHHYQRKNRCHFTMPLYDGDVTCVIPSIVPILVD